MLGGLPLGEGSDPANGCLRSPNGGGWNPGGSPGMLALLILIGVLGVLTLGGGGDVLGLEAGLLCDVFAVVVAVVVDVVTKLKGGVDLIISSCGKGSFNMAAKLLVKLLVISAGFRCLLRCTSSLSFSVKPWLQMLQ